MLSAHQDLAAANLCFSFPSPAHSMNDSSNEFEFDGWDETIKGGPWNGGAFRNYGYYGNPSSHELSWLANDGDSTVASAPSGENKGLPTSQNYTIEDYNDYQKPDTQHRQEMLNMVNNMSDSTFEVSLRHLIKLPKIANSIQETPGKGKEDKFLSAEAQKKEKKGMKRGSRSESMDNGAFLLKVFFPVLLGGRRKSSVTSGSSLPKPMLTDGEKGMVEKNTNGKWWKENELGYSSPNNGTNSRRRRKNGCYFFFLSSKSKN
ncbi:uncharacterized protein [Elaeis guineensis]|uniref:Uncharacterized protein LOC105037464 n=1 Tax=Elaeis guineensis var. tenera TaxID=51953 RepID=A0A6I9QLH7_ELAGV|nr:uncharacterized protein LOC105037464 [Elaeis guineensis]